jgi:hypothetical protein
MDQKEVIKTCMESPLYFTMSAKKRLEFLKRRKWRACFTNYLREDLLAWVKTGDLNFTPGDTPGSERHHHP